MDRKRWMHGGICSLFALNIIFWLGVFLRHALRPVGNVARNPFLVALIGLEPMIFIFFFVAYLRRWKLICIGSLFFLGANSILSIADDVGAMDYISLGLSLFLLILLILNRRRFSDREKTG